jgi:hypothetical protein
MTCPECNDTGMIERPVYRVVRKYAGHRPIEFEAGGPDACPRCTRLAEAEWRARGRR